jgi:hypothetical protein
MRGRTGLPSLARRLGARPLHRSIGRVVIDVSGEHYVDHETEVLAYLAPD